jgi:hypothetical protein
MDKIPRWRYMWRGMKLVVKIAKNMVRGEPRHNKRGAQKVCLSMAELLHKIERKLFAGEGQSTSETERSENEHDRVRKRRNGQGRVGTKNMDDRDGRMVNTNLQRRH